jgi:hypothetical protein
MAPLRNLSASPPAPGPVKTSQLMTDDEFQANAMQQPGEYDNTFVWVRIA